jgi:hypothetical protein
MEDLVRMDNGGPPEKTPEGLRIRGPHDGAGRLLTRKEIAAGFTATFVVKTDSTNVRLYYGDKGVVIFNWEMRRDELRHRDPRTGEHTGKPGAGRIPKDTWVTVTWTITATDSIVAVDGQERGTLHADYKGLRGRLGVGTSAGATVTLKSLTVGPPVKPDAVKTDAGDKADGGPVFVSVPAAKPSAGSAKRDDGQPIPPPTGPDPIERPQFRDRPKALVKGLTSVTSMMVLVSPDGQATGLTSDIIATVPAASRREDKAGAGFARADGDPSMRTAFEEAVRAVTLRYPLWEPGRIDVSFGEKFVAHGGPSAGVAFGLLLLSTLEGFDIDPACAVTGDITVDWKVRKVGGVTAKLRGAALDKRAYAAIPRDNEMAAADLAVLYGDSALWDIQVFSVGTLQEAVAVARRDRPARLARAIRQFDDLRPELVKGGRPFLARPATREALKAILELAPNHLSARYLLAVGEGKFARTLSANATLHQLSVIFYPYAQILAAGKFDRASLPQHVTLLARKRLNALRPIAHKDAQPLLADMAAFVEAADGRAAGTLSPDRLLTQLQKLQAGFAALGSDTNLVEKLVREAY